MCGASAEQKASYASQSAFSNEMTAEYAQVFAKDQAILDTVTSVYKPILEAGPNQKGFSAEEETNLRTESKEGLSTSFANAKRALEEGIASRQGDVYAPSGQEDQLRAILASSEAQEEGRQNTAITAANYAEGRSQFDSARNALLSASGQLDPARFAEATTGAGSAAAKTANDIAAASNAWMAPVFGAIGAVGGAATGAEIMHH